MTNSGTKRPQPEPFIRPARDDNVLLAFRRRCLFARAAPARQMAHWAGMSGTTARELDLLPPRRDAMRYVGLA
jgi:hypothetical protein